MADKAGLQIIGLVMASLTTSVILIAAVLAYKSAGGAFADQVNIASVADAELKSH